MLTDPFFLAMAIPAVAIMGISKGGFAGGLGLVGAPLIALAASLAGSVGAAWGRVANEGLKLLAVSLILHFAVTRLARAPKT